MVIRHSRPALTRDKIPVYGYIFDCREGQPEKKEVWAVALCKDKRLVGDNGLPGGAYNGPK
ncbi:hypothetical protein PanWU01x14_014440, partial [Parasponia andersonii]